MTRDAAREGFERARRLKPDPFFTAGVAARVELRFGRDAAARGTRLVLAVLLLVGAIFLVRNLFFAPTKITAYFPSATGIYAGDEVRVSTPALLTMMSSRPNALTVPSISFCRSSACRSRSCLPNAVTTAC